MHKIYDKINDEVFEKNMEKDYITVFCLILYLKRIILNTRKN